MPTKKKTNRSVSRKTSPLKKSTTKKTAGVKRKVRTVMHEYKEGKLHSRSKRGPLVTSRKQAVAIALHEAGVSKKRFKKKTSRKKSS